MKITRRSNLQHFVQFFVGAVQKTADTAIVYSKGVLLKYDINSLHSKKKKVSAEIIEHVRTLIKEGKSDICRDVALVGLFSKLNRIEINLADHEKMK